MTAEPIAPPGAFQLATDVDSGAVYSVVVGPDRPTALYIDGVLFWVAGAAECRKLAKKHALRGFFTNRNPDRTPEEVEQLVEGADVNPLRWRTYPLGVAGR